MSSRPAAVVAGVLSATTPLWSLLIGLALGSERPLRATRSAGLALGFAGVLLIFAPRSHGSGLMSRGALALLGASASYAVAFAYMARRLTGRGTPPMVLSAAQLLTATGLSTPALAAGGTPAVTVTLGAVVLDEPLTLRVVAGMAAVLVGVGLTREGARTARPPAPGGPAQSIGSATKTGMSRSVLRW